MSKALVAVRHRLRNRSERGAATAEYAVSVVAVCGLGGILVARRRGRPALTRPGRSRDPLTRDRPSPPEETQCHPHEFNAPPQAATAMPLATDARPRSADARPRAADVVR